MSVEELESIGLERMDDDAIRGALESQRVGVLGLPGGDHPYLVPLSYGFDGESACYFTYGLGSESLKEELTEAAEAAQFLVYRVDTPYTWESVLVAGPIDRVPESEWESVEEHLSETWYPGLFEDVELSRGVAVYRLEIDERSGIRHTGLPPEIDSRGID